MNLEKGFSLVKAREALRLKAYKCPAGKWTIGWGHTKGVKPGDVITREQAEKLFQEDVEDTLSVIKKYDHLNDNQVSALFSLVFNIGETQFNDSTVKKEIERDPTDRNRIQKAWKAWRLSKGKIMKGLIVRRQEEIDLFFSAV